MELADTATVRLPAELSPGSVGPLRAALDAAFEGPARVVVLTGADDATFCTGLALDPAEGRPVETAAFAEVLALVADAPKPTAAFVDGRAIGGGLGLAATCDWVVATERATFALPELLWGIIPAMIWPLVVARLGESGARRWTVSAHARSAQDARDAGLVDELAATGRELRDLQRATRMLLRAEPTALRHLRRWARETRQQPLDDVLVRGADLTGRMATAPTSAARVAAFRNGEAPWR